MKQHSKILIASLVLFVISIIAIVVTVAVAASRSGHDTYKDKKTEDACATVQSTKKKGPCGAWKDNTCFRGHYNDSGGCEYPGDPIVGIPIVIGGLCLLTSIILLVVGLVLASKGK